MISSKIRVKISEIITMSKIHDASYDVLPKLVVFDVDECLLTPDSYLIQSLPNPNDIIKADLNGKGIGTIGAKLNNSNPNKRSVDDYPWDHDEKLIREDVYKLYPGALHALQQHHLGSFPNTRFSLASSSVNDFTCSCIHKALSILEVVPGVTVLQVLNKKIAK